MSGTSCSNCDATDDLYFVTLGIAGPDQPGRAVLHCPRCRRDTGQQVDISWPLRLLTPGTFLELYRTGKVETDPQRLSCSVFGRGHDWIADEASDMLQRRRPGEPDP